MNEHNPQDDAVDEFKHALRRQVGQRINVLALTPGHARTLDTALVAEKMIAAIPTQDPLGQVAGSFYDTTGLQSWLGISRKALDKRVRASTLVAAPLGGGRRVYPAWQCTQGAQVRPALLTTWRILREHGDPWTAIVWLWCTANRSIDGQRAAGWLTADRNPEPVEVAARADAARRAA